MGLAGSWAAGAVLVDGDEPARFDQVTTRRAVIFTGGQPSPAARPPRRLALGAVRGRRVRRRRGASAAPAPDAWTPRRISPRPSQTTGGCLPVIGYVKTHHRRMLAREHWVRVPELTAGERSEEPMARNGRGYVERARSLASRYSSTNRTSPA